MILGSRLRIKVPLAEHPLSFKALPSRAKSTPAFHTRDTAGKQSLSLQWGSDCDTLQERNMLGNATSKLSNWAWTMGAESCTNLDRNTVVTRSATKVAGSHCGLPHRFLLASFPFNFCLTEAWPDCGLSQEACRSRHGLDSTTSVRAGHPRIWAGCWSSCEH